MAKAKGKIMLSVEIVPYLGSFGFGAIVGWLVYYINRYRKADVQFSDLTTVIGIIGGAAVTQIYGGGDKALFGAYGIGLFSGFFGYFIALIVMVRRSGGVFTVTWFLDGRRKTPGADETIQGEPLPGNRPMDMNTRMSAVEEKQAQVDEAITRAATSGKGK